MWKWRERRQVSCFVVVVDIVVVVDVVDVVVVMKDHLEKGERTTTRHLNEGCAKCGSGERDIRLVFVLLKSLLLLLL